jgi:hypothetical protein
MDMIPLLNQGSKGLADAQAKAAAYAEKLAELAPKADEFNDRLKELDLSAKSAAINGLLPMMDGLVGVAAFLGDVAAGGDKARQALEWMSESSTIGKGLARYIEFAQTANALAGIGQGPSRRESGGKIGAGSGTGLLLPGGNSAAEAAATARGLALNHALGGRSTKAGNAGGSSGGAARDDFTPLIRQISERTSALSIDAATTEKLTAAQSMALKVMTDLQGGYLKLNDAQKALLAGRLEEMLATDKQNEAINVENKARAEAAKAAEHQAAADAGLAAQWRDQLDPARALAREVEELNRLREEGYLRADEAARAEDILTQ